MMVVLTSLITVICTEHGHKRKEIVRALVL